MNCAACRFAGFAVLVFAGAALGIGLTDYRIERVAIGVPEDLKSCMPGKAHLFNNVLRFDGVPDGVPLAKSATVDAAEQLGFDAGTLQLRWLDPDELLWITWRTISQGQGSYSKEGHLVIRVTGNRFQEVFRDSIYAHGAGSTGGTNCHLEVTYEANRKLLTLRHSRTNWTRGEDLQVDETRGATVHSVWEYGFDKGSLRFVGGERS